MTAHAMIFGHSHVWSVRRAVASGWSHPGVKVRVPICGTKEFPGPVVYELDNGRVALNPVLMAALNTVMGTPEEPDTWLVSMTQGNFYNQLGMVAEGGLFDFVLAGRPDLPLVPDLVPDLVPGAVVLPCGAVRAALEALMREVVLFLKRLVNLPFRDRIILVGPPPPPRDGKLIEDLLAHVAPGSGSGSGAQASGAAASGAAALVSPGSVRLKLWHLQNQITAEYCAARKVHYRAGDLPGVQDADGFLRPELIRDAAHANHLYSAILLDAIAAIITAPAPTPAAAPPKART